MIKINDPDLIAIFLNKSQKKLYYENNISPLLINNFVSKLKTIFKDTRIFSNVTISIENLTTIETESEIDFLLKVSQNLSKSTSGDIDIDEIYLAFIRGIYPLIDINLTNSLIERHKKYISQYSYSENLPVGIIPFLISREFISTLPESSELNFHDFLLKNINQYDTEIFYEPPDLRNLRLDFSLNNQRSIMLTEKLLSHDRELQYKDIYNILKNEPEIFRGAPSYIELELYRGCEYNCTFCYRSVISNENDGKFISIDSIKNLVTQLESFHSKFTICLGGMGEPFHHPEILPILKFMLNSEYIEEVIIESALYLDTSLFIEFLNSITNEEKRKLSLIVNLSTINENSFKKLYPNSKLNPESIIEKIKQLKPNLFPNSLFVQILKIKEVESEIENYFSFFESLSIQVILQKYNSFAGRMTEKRVSNLTPINREFCWHLARDLYIQSDGNVLACKQTQSEIIGNIYSSNIQEIWLKNSKRFKSSFHGLHDEIGLPCLSCDEWYTFNA